MTTNNRPTESTLPETHVMADEWDIGKNITADWLFASEISGWRSATAFDKLRKYDVGWYAKPRPLEVGK